MKKLVLLSLLLIQFIVSCGQQNSPNSNQIENYNCRYKVYKTENIYCLLELDTYTGKIYQIHYTIQNDGFEGKILLDSLPSFIVDETRKKIPFKVKHLNFELIPTKNMYTFILLEQYSGNIWHVQWNNDEKYRFIVEID